MCDAKRLRQRERQSTSLFSKNTNNNNNNNFARAGHFLYISLPLLLQREASQLDFLGRKCVVCAYIHTKKNCCLCSCSRFNFFLFLFLLFTVAHFHVAGHQHFSFSHHRYKILMFFFQRNSSPLFFISSCSSLFVFCCLLSRFLCLFLFSKFVKMASYLSLILQTTQIQKQFPLCFLSGYGRLLILASQDAIFRQTNLELQLGNAIPFD